MTKVNVLVGCNYPPADTRAEPGDVIEVDDKIAKALIDAGAAEPHKASPGSKDKKSTDSTSQAPTEALTGEEG